MKVGQPGGFFRLACVARNAPEPPVAPRGPALSQPHLAALTLKERPGPCSAPWAGGTLTPLRTLLASSRLWERA